ncbi:putative oxidoreductase [Synechococcus sp. BOUM118]|nr:putative oxidoreductase [Synechococcus sp. BOUM118]
MTVNVAIVGCGRISKNHISALTANFPRAIIKALCDIDESRLVSSIKLISESLSEETAFDNDICKYTDYEAMINDISQESITIDLIVITSPSGLHPTQVIAAANAGVNVCTEKPMATRWADGLAMVKACDFAKVKLFVVKQNRYNPTISLLKSQITKGRFGRIYMVTANVFWQRPQAYYDQADWRGTWEFDGGALMNQASHYVDLLEWLVGPVESVNALTSTLGRNIEVEDTAAINLKWRCGALGTMAVTMLTYPENMEGSITILGEFGSVRIGGKAANKIEYWKFSTSSSDDELVRSSNYEISSVYGNGHQAYYENMLDALEGASTPICDGREGLKSLELLVGMYQSSRNGERIALPLEL